MSPKSPFDEKVPASLKETQLWFGSVISRPLQGNKMMKSSPSGASMVQEARQYIAPSPTLRSHQRIELYNQQYWWRLLNIMQDTFPLVVRLFGFYNFNEQIAVPYLVKYRPDHWSLNTLGDNLCKWIEERYNAKDKKLVLDAAKVDWCCTSSFVDKQLPSLELDSPNPDDIAELLDKTLFLQKHVHLFAFDYDLFAFREEFLKKDGDYGVNNDFPKMPKEKKKYFFVLYRARNLNIAWHEISEAEHFMLSQFKNGTSIEKACESLDDADEAIADAAAEKLQHWIQDWVLRRFFALVSN